MAICLSLAAAASAQARDLQAFVSQLQRAVQADSRKDVADMVRYPITISISGLRVPIPDAATFLNRYDDVFNPPLRDQIARASVSQGKLVGAPDMSIEDTNGVLQITRITVPTYTAAPPTLGTASTAERKSEPRRVAIRVGPRPTQIAGSLASNGVDVYLVFIPKGTTAAVRLERAPVGAAAIRVLHARTGAPLSARGSGEGRYISGRPAEDAEYRIEVRRLDTRDDAHLPYLLSFSLR